MKIRTGKVSPLARVRDVDGCVNFGCMALDGREAWGLKTDMEENLSVLYYCRDVFTRVTRHYRIENLLGHGNGMTCDRDFLYFAAARGDVPPQRQNRYILRLPRSFRGDLKDAVKIETPDPVTAISYYKKDHVIIRVRSDVKGFMKYAIGRISVDEAAKSGSMRYVSYIYVNQDTAGLLTQDIYFDRSRRLLFIPVSRRDDEGLILTNRIFIVDMAGPREIMNESRTFTPISAIAIDMDEESGFRKFEVESLGIGPDGRIILSANARGKFGDHFFQITNIRF